MLDKEIIKRNFSRYARYYDRYSNIQDLCALRLIEKLKADGFEKILDVGCGTGNYTRLLREKFPSAQIKAIDISDEMVKIAKGKLKNNSIEFIAGDGETMEFKERFDLISSNASLQWFESLGQTLRRYKGALNRDGVLLFSTFGPLTFNELNQCLKILFAKDISISAANFIDAEGLRKILSRLYREVKVEQRIYKERHASLSELFKKIRYSGIRGNGANGKNFWIPRMVDELEKIYRQRFKGIITTYQVFFCRGIK